MNIFLVAFTIPVGILLVGRHIRDNRKGTNGILKLERRDTVSHYFTTTEQDFFFFRRIVITSTSRALQVCGAKFPMLPSSLKRQTRSHAIWSARPVEVTIIKYKHEAEIKHHLLQIAVSRAPAWGNNAVGALQELNNAVIQFESSPQLSSVK